VEALKLSLLDKGKKVVSDFFDKKKEEREFQEKLDREARETERRVYEQEFRKAALKASMIRARRDAEQKSGLAKLRAINTSMSGGGAPKGNFLTKLSEYTQANIARREANIRRTEALRKAAIEMRQKKSSIGTNNNRQRPPWY
jgi:hypothetical protein